MALLTLRSFLLRSFFFLWLALPFCFARSVFAQTVNQANPKGTIRCTFFSSRPTPFEVWLGADTNLTWKLQTVAPDGRLIRSSGFLLEDARLVETDEGGKTRRIWNFHSSFYAPSPQNLALSEKVLLDNTGWGIANSAGSVSKYLMALRRLPHPKRRLELKIDAVWRPASPLRGTARMSPAKKERLIRVWRAQPDALSFTRTYLLRRTGQSTTVPATSRRSNFEIENIEFEGVRPNICGTPISCVVWTVRWTGKTQPVSTVRDGRDRLTIRNDKQHFIADAIGYLRIEPLAFPRFRIRKELFPLPPDHPLRSTTQNLFLQGWVSVGGSWPRWVRVRLPKNVIFEGEEASAISR